MCDGVGLVDLSLFAESPTNDLYFSIPPLNRHQSYGDAYGPSRYRSHTIPGDYINKPLPPLPSRTICARTRVNASRTGDEDSRCILKRIQRIGSNDHSTGRANTLLQRRNRNSPPELTLSVPRSSPWNGNPASAMVWMPDEQMWLIAGETQREVANQSLYQNAYPSPPSYTPRAPPLSEPLPTIQHPGDLTPPLTPIQCQLQSLIQPPRPRDEERLSPLFQEAMNSVPMLDPEELVLPSLTIDTNLNPQRDSLMQLLRPQSAFERSTSHPGAFERSNSHAAPLERSASDISPQSTVRMSRSASAGSRVSHSRSDTTDSRSYYSATSVDLSQPSQSATRWAGLAKKVARPEAALS